MASIYDFSINGSDHKPYNLNQHKGKPLLIINLPLSGKQPSIPPTFEAVRSIHFKYRSKISIIGIPLSDPGDPKEERSIFAEYPILDAVQVKNTFGGTIDPPLYHFLNTSLSALATADGGMHLKDRLGPVDKKFMCFLIDKSGRLQKILQPDTNESDMDREVAELINPSAAAKESSNAAAGELSSEELLRFIVDKVNELFSLTYSIVAFDELRGRKLLQLVNDIFGRLQPQLAMDMIACPLDDAIPRMIEFLTKTLGYKIPPLLQGNFDASFRNAETTVIYPVLYWTLSRMEQNEKRVYLARFLQPLTIPEDILSQDEDVRMLYSQYQTLRAQFVPTHRRVEELRKAFADPQQARREVSALEMERDQLMQYIKTAQAKIETTPEKEALLKACRALRLAQEEENKLAEKKVELVQGKTSAEVHFAEMTNRLQNLRRDTVDGRADAIIRRLKDEIQTNRIKLEEQLPVEMERMHVENDELRRLLTEPLDMAQLQSESQLLERELTGLRAKMQERMKPGDDGTSIATIQQQAQRVQNRKSELMKELSSLQADHNQVLSEIASVTKSMQFMLNSTEKLTQDSLEELMQDVRVKHQATESMRTHLEETRAEWGTLVFTENILKEEFQELDRQIGDLESKLGMQGYTHTLETINRLTHEKDSLEELKGKTLEELSKVVQDMVMLIRDRRTKIAPLINELRTVRDAAAEVEREWAEKKSQYEYQEGLLIEDIRKLSDTVANLKAETQSNESLYHRLNAQRELINANKKRVEDEKRYQTDDEAFLDPQYKTYEDFYDDMTETLEQRNKDMQARRRDIEENHEINAQQVEWFRNLKKILEAKVKCMNAVSAANPDGIPSIDDEIKRTMGTAGVNMLVLNNN